MNIRIDFLAPTKNIVRTSNLNGEIEILSPAVSINRSFTLTAEIKSATQAYCELVADAANSMPEVIAASKKIESLLITDTASGPIASFPDGADGMPLKSLVVDIDPVQDLHGYANPWPAGGGKNKLNITNITPTKTENGITFTVNPDGTVKANGTATSQCQIFWLIPANVAKTFGGLKAAIAGAGNGGIYLELNGPPYTQFINNSTRLIDSSISNVDKGVNLIWRISQGVTLNNFVYGPMLYDPSITDTSFAPYSNICPISGWTGADVFREENYDPDADPVLSVTWSDEAGTVYGGTVDVTNGVLRADRAKVKLSDLSWNSYSSPSNGIFRAPIDGILCPGRQTPSSAISDALSAKAYAPITGPDYGRFAVTNDTGRLVIPTNMLYTTVQNFLANMGDIVIVYPLATPIEYTLTPEQVVNTLKGQNNIWADTGNTEVKYVADPRLFIEKLIAAIS